MSSPLDVRNCTIGPPKMSSLIDYQSSVMCSVIKSVLWVFCDIQYITTLAVLYSTSQPGTYSLRFTMYSQTISLCFCLIRESLLYSSSKVESKNK